MLQKALRPFTHTPTSPLRPLPFLIKHTRPLTTSNPSTNTEFTHLSSTPHGENIPSMVDVSGKSVSRRTATALAVVSLPSEVAKKLASPSRDLSTPKGGVFSTAIVSGVLGVKKTSELIPFCHPIPIEDCKINIQLTDTLPSPFSDNNNNNTSHTQNDNRRSFIEIRCFVAVQARTGVEMEALTGASVSALCVVDMCKSVTKDLKIEGVVLLEKTGGKSSWVKHE